MIEPARASWLAFLSLASAWAAAVAGLAVLPLSGSAFAIATGPAAPAAAMLAGWLGVIVASLALAYAAASAAVAYGLHRGRGWARGAALGLAVANLFAPPFGTAHGAYALWLLLGAARPDPVHPDPADPDSADQVTP